MLEAIIVNIDISAPYYVLLSHGSCIVQLENTVTKSVVTKLVAIWRLAANIAIGQSDWHKYNTNTGDRSGNTECQMYLGKTIMENF